MTSSFSTFQSLAFLQLSFFWSFIEEYQFARIVRFKFESAGFPNPRSYLALHDSELEPRRVWLGLWQLLCTLPGAPGNVFHAAVTLALSFHFILWEMSHSVVEKKHFHVFLNSFGQIFDQRSIYPCFLSRKTEESCVPGDLQV